ncbi:MAG: hypothetical protein HFE78_02140 [Clostridiales bacterium]|nr:hypothetical protein [Clostridiales bacterium]
MNVKYRIVSLLLSALVIYFSFSGLIFADDVQTGTCTHRHTEECYKEVSACLYQTDDTAAENDAEPNDTVVKEEHICSKESGCVTKVLFCSHVHDAKCGYFNEKGSHLILSWEWIDEEGYLVQDEATGVWGLGLPGANEKSPVTEQMLSELLPAEITAVFSDNSSKVLPLKWDYTSFPNEGAYEGDYTLTAALQENYRLAEETAALSVLVSLGSGQTLAVSDSVLQQHVVTDGVVEPADMKLNLFDYGVNVIAPTSGDILTKESNRHFRASGSNAPFSGINEWNRGINKDHLLIFGDGLVHGGFWNKGAGESNTYGKEYAGMEGIVKNVLENGYPSINTAAARDQLLGDQSVRDWTKIMDWKLAGDHIEQKSGSYWTYDGLNPQNLSDQLIANWEKATGQTIETGTESLDYLFNPEIEHDFKETYKNVTGLFQLDDQGYYYYDMRYNFAEFDKEANKFVLYDAPATRRSDEKGPDGKGSTGNFFPFNTGAQVFSDTDAQGNLTSDVPCSGSKNGGQYINHHFGMTMEVDFRQPVLGKINVGGNGEQNDMVFEFSGDDDVWIYIDGVLVLDLGGIHSEIYGTINFATGEVCIGRAYGNIVGLPDEPTNPDQLVTQTTLKDLFEAAGVDTSSSTQWRENTFASNTDHNLQLFYLERGNYDSSLSMRFNLVPRLFQQIKKVNQDGNPIENVEFAMHYAVETADGFVADGPALITLKTDADGTAPFVEPNSITKDNAQGSPFNFIDRYVEGHEYYILKETVTPFGYRSLPIDVVLRFDPENTMLIVQNPWITGAYASFTSTITGSRGVTYGVFDELTGDIKPSGDVLDADIQSSGLVVAVPMLLEESTGKWKALYGSNVNGFNAIKPEFRTEESWRESLLTAVLYQCSDTRDNVPSWHLEWNQESHQLEGTLSDLPGRADRYLLNNNSGDMKMVYAIIDYNSLAKLGVSDPNVSSDEKYEAIGAYINQLVAGGMTREDAVKVTRDLILNGNGDDRDLHTLNTDQFNRNFRSLIYIPNEQRELRIWKVDQNGNRRNGAEFTLYRDAALTDEVVRGVTATVGDQDGVLIFTPSPEKTETGETAPGYAQVLWARSQHDKYYLKETNAPEGCELNETVIPVHVGIYSIYADAGTSDDGVTVMAGVGKLVQTMKKYAADEEVNITLRDITANAEVQETGTFQMYGWQPMNLDGTNVQRSINLHYGKNALVDYGMHDEDGGQIYYPYFVTDTGFIRTRIRQNWSGLDGTSNRYGDEGTNYDANKENLGDSDITSLFSLLNIVVVTDQTSQDSKTGELTVSKIITGGVDSDDEYNRNFLFDLKLTDENGNEIDPSQQFYFYGTNKSGYISNGGTILLHHDESITILGLPEGTHFTVTEKMNQEHGYTPLGGVIREGTIVSNRTAAAKYINVRGETLPFTFTKVDAEDLATPLAGAKFMLYWWSDNGTPDTALIPLAGPSEDSGWTLVSSVTSDANGEVNFGSLAEGTYRLLEVLAPDGYILPRAQWQLSVVSDADAMKLASITTVGVLGDKPPAFAVTEGAYKLPNMPEVTIPFTGAGQQPYPFRALGVGMLCTAALTALGYSAFSGRKAKRKKKENVIS